MKENNSNNFKTAFQQFLREENLEKTYHEKRLLLLWPEIVGKPIASRTHNIFIKNKVLFVKLTSAPLKQDLTGKRDFIIQLINEKMGVSILDDIRFL
jgi:predicted nucleic acid-binding Zn ribbon protein